MAKITFTTDAEGDLKGGTVSSGIDFIPVTRVRGDLDRSAQLIVLKALRKLETDPEKRGQPLGSTAGGNLSGLRKLVVGNRTYRVVYRVEPSGDLVVVFVIGRGADNEVYELAVSRMRMHEDPQIRGFAASLGELLPNPHEQR